MGSYRRGDLPPFGDLKTRKLMQLRERFLRSLNPQQDGGGGGGSEEEVVVDLQTSTAGPFKAAATTFDSLGVEPAGAIKHLRFVGSVTLTSTENVTLTAPFTPADENDVLTLISDGDRWIELARSNDDLERTFVPARRWGAKPDTGADMTSKIQAAFDNCPLGATLVFEPGTYTCTGSITWTRAVNLWAKGAVFHYGTTVLTAPAFSAGTYNGVQLGEVFGHMPEIRRTYTGSDYTTLLYEGVNITAINCYFWHPRVVGFFEGILLRGLDATGGCAYNSIYEYWVTDCLRGLVLRAQNSGWANENTFHGGRHLTTSGFGAARDLFFDAIWINYASSSSNEPNNNVFNSICFESNQRRKIVCEGSANYFNYCRYETATHVVITVGTTVRSGDYIGNVFNYGYNLNSILLNDYIEYANGAAPTPTANNRTVVNTHWGVQLFGGNSPVPTLHLAPGSRTSEIFRLSVPVPATSSFEPRLLAHGEEASLSFFGITTPNRSAVMKYYNNSGTLIARTYLSNATVGGGTRPAFTLAGMGLAVNALGEDVDSRIAGNSVSDPEQTFLTYWDSTAPGRVGIGTGTPATKLHVVSDSTGQFRIAYDGTYYTSFTSNTGASLFDGLAIEPQTNASGFRCITLFGAQSDTAAFTLFYDPANPNPEMWIGRQFRNASATAVDTVFAVDTGAGFSFRINFNEAMGITSTGAVFQVPGSYRILDGVTGGVSQILDIYHQTSGTPTAGFGSRFIWRLENAGATISTVLTEEISFITPTASSEDTAWRIQMKHGGTDRDVFHLYTGTGGSAVFNEEAQDIDFRVESTGRTHMLFVDAANDRVGIGTSAPGVTLGVNGPIHALSSAIGAGGDPGAGVTGFFRITNITASAAGGSGPATIGNYGSPGQPTAAAQSHWLKVYDGTTVRYIPCWT